MDPNIRDGAAAIINKYGPVPEYVKYKYGDDIVFGEVEHCYWEDSMSSFILDIIHTKKLISWPGHEGDGKLSRAWPISMIDGRRIRIETATEMEYLMSLVLES